MMDSLQTGLLLLAAVGVGLLAERLAGPNPWVLGPLLLAIAVAVSLPEARLHPVLVAGGQILLGWNLGQKFSPRLFREAPRLVVASALMTLGFSVLALGLALAVWLGTSLSWTTSFVATTPGGIAEMALTAKALSLNPPAVTAFQAVRLVLMVAGAGLMIRLAQRWGWLTP
jgi:membrane AbrB-like protein